MIGSRTYRGGNLVAENIPHERLSEVLADRDCFVWLDVAQATAAEWRLLTDMLGIHALAIEDAHSVGERAKLEYYRDVAVLTLYATVLDDRTRRLTEAEVTAVVAASWIVTVRKDLHFPVAKLVDRWDAAADLAKTGPLFFVWGLLDVVVDSQAVAALDLEVALDELAEAVFDTSAPTREVQSRGFEARKSIGRLRRRTTPMPDIIETLMPPRRRAPFVADSSLEPYLRDVHDHAIRAADLAEAARELEATIITTDATLRGDRLNQIMKKLTGWAAILVVPTIVFGFYGMNTRLFPSAGSWAGLWVAIGLVVTVSTALFIVFRRKDWL